MQEKLENIVFSRFEGARGERKKHIFRTIVPVIDFISSEYRQEMAPCSIVNVLGMS